MRAIHPSKRVGTVLALSSLFLASTVAFSPQTPALHPTARSSYTATTTSLQATSLLSSSSDQPEEPTTKRPGTRLKMFSATAIRSSWRAATGLSLTTLWLTTYAATSAWIRSTMTVILRIFPDWFRYFWQPLLILYYAPLFILRNLTKPGRSAARQTHLDFVDGFKDAIAKADESTTYWPIHVRDDGEGGRVIEKDLAELDTNQAILESVEVSLDEEDDTKKKK